MCSHYPAHVCYNYQAWPQLDFQTEYYIRLGRGGSQGRPSNIRRIGGVRVGDIVDGGQFNPRCLLGKPPSYKLQTPSTASGETNCFCIQLSRRIESLRRPTWGREHSNNTDWYTYTTTHNNMVMLHVRKMYSTSHGSHSPCWMKSHSIVIPLLCKGEVINRFASLSLPPFASWWITSHVVDTQTSTWPCPRWPSLSLDGGGWTDGSVTSHSHTDYLSGSLTSYHISRCNIKGTSHLCGTWAGERVAVILVGVSSPVSGQGSTCPWAAGRCDVMLLLC